MVSVVSEESLLKNLGWESRLGLGLEAIAWGGFAGPWGEFWGGLQKSSTAWQNSRSPSIPKSWIWD